MYKRQRALWRSSPVEEVRSDFDQLRGRAGFCVHERTSSTGELRQSARAASREQYDRLGMCDKPVVASMSQQPQLSARLGPRRNQPLRHVTVKV